MSHITGVGNILYHENFAQMGQIGFIILLAIIGALVITIKTDTPIQPNQMIEKTIKNDIVLNAQHSSIYSGFKKKLNYRFLLTVIIVFTINFLGRACMKAQFDIDVLAEYTSIKSVSFYLILAFILTSIKDYINEIFDTDLTTKNPSPVHSIISRLLEILHPNYFHSFINDLKLTTPQ